MVNEGLTPPPHQRLHVTTADLAPLGSQQASQHAAPGERELQMQSVETPHDREVGGGHRTRQVIDAAPAMLSALACLVIGRSCVRSIIALRSAGPLC